MSTYLHLQHWSLEPEDVPFIQRLSQNARRTWHKNPVYSFSLSSHGKQELFFVPTDSWPGSLTEGQRLLEGKFVLGSETALEQYLWSPSHLSQSALADLHSFEWLRNLRSLGDNASRRIARQLILSWINHNQNWRSLAWRPDIIGHRLSTWLGLYDFFCASADDFFRQEFFKSLYRQTRHLSRSWRDAPSAPQRLYALHGLILMLICLNHETHRLPGLFQNLHSLIEIQILEDGGHKSRSPLIQLMVLRMLIDLRSLLRHIKPGATDQDFNGKNGDFLKRNTQKKGAHSIVDPPEKGVVYLLLILLHKTIAKMAPLVRLFRHGDGSLACFGPYHRINPNLVDMVLSLADVRGRPPVSARHMGYERCTSKTGLVLMNLKPSTLRSPSNTVEQGTGIFNFEWSTPRRRLITFSDIVIQSESLGQGGRSAQAVESKHGYFSCQHKAHPEGTLLEAEYQCHHPSWNFSQSRSLFLSNEALDFRGEDILASHLSGYYAIRFVMHPELRLTQRDKRIYIDSPDGQRWICLSNSSEVHIEVLDTSYPAQMILLLGEITPSHPCRVRWAFKAQGA